ncbi:MAG TPA: hypothetical protein ENJ80_01810, partial [Gammaproteobacteria bacterium]|nr:hypothetical protein [Gammaproteobacteria bacterium]
VIVNQSFAVDENSANGTSVGTVAASDQDPADTLSYSITAGNTGNAFAINASTGEITVNDSTQLDFESNPSFNLTVQVQDNGTGTLSDTATVTINLNDIDDTPPSVVANNGLTLAEGGTATISSAILSVTDTQQPAGSVNYTVIGGLTNGQLELTTAPGVAVTTFTQADIDAGLLVYVHDGSETLGDNFDFNVDDGLGNRITEQTFSIVVTPVDDTPPAIINNTGAHVGVGGSFVVTTDMLLAADTQPSSGLTYTLTSLPEGGELSINGVVLGLNDTFTQADIDAGSLLYTQTSLAGGDEGFTFSIDDGLGNRVTGIKFAVTPIILDGLDPVVTIDAGVPPVPVVPVPGVVNAAPVTPLIPLESGPVTSGGGSHGNPGGALEESAPPAGAPPGAPLLQPVVEAPVKDAQLQSTTIKAPENKAERSEPADQRLSDALWLALNRAQMDMDESAAPLPWLLAATRGAVWTFSAGFLAWILRGGSLLAMALSSMPMWRWMDPLPILPISRRERDERKRKSQEEAQHEIEEHRAVAAVLDKRSHQGGRM